MNGTRKVNFGGQMNYKICTKCGEKKLLAEFHKKSRKALKPRKDDRRARCISCFSELARQYYEDNKEARTLRNKKYHQKSREEILRKQREKYHANKESESLRKKKYYLDNKEMLSSKTSKYWYQRKSEEPTCIYQIRNKETDKRYVGSTDCGSLRYGSHLRALRRKDHHSPGLQEDFNKFGEAAFVWEIIKEIKDQKQLIKEERNIIKKLSADGIKLYNEQWLT